MKYIKELNIDFNNWDEVENYNEFYGHKIFFNFLKKNNILDSYINNFYNIDNSRMIRYKENLNTIKEFLDSNIKKNFIDSAFAWELTSEKPSFWIRYNVRWLKYYK